jgi:hypothetical protein
MAEFSKVSALVYSVHTHTHTHIYIYTNIYFTFDS